MNEWMCSEKLVLIRVGADSGCRPIHANGPLLPDGSFELVPIPDLVSAGEERTYGNTMGQLGRPLVDYFPNRRAILAEQPMHVDPEFETCTYGSPARIQSKLATLEAGDLLVFYGGLRPVDADGRPFSGSIPTCYLFGYFEVAAAVRAREHDRDELLTQFGGNFHVRHADVFARQQETLVLVKGGPGSRLLRRAIRISEPGAGRSGRRIQVLSAEMRAIFGPLAGIGSIQRCTPRWIDARCVADTAGFLRALP